MFSYHWETSSFRRKKALTFKSSRVATWLHFWRKKGLDLIWFHDLYNDTLRQLRSNCKRLKKHPLLFFQANFEIKVNLQPFKKKSCSLRGKFKSIFLSRCCDRKMLCVKMGLSDKLLLASQLFKVIFDNFFHTGQKAGLLPRILFHFSSQN